MSDGTIFLVRAEKGRGPDKLEVAYAFESREDGVGFLGNLNALKWNWTAEVIRFVPSGQPVEGFPVQGRLLEGGE